MAATILAGCVIAYLIRQRYPTTSVLIVVSIVLASMTYQRLVAPNTATPLAAILVVGFIVSVMLKGKVMWTMHCIAFLILNTVFVLQVESRVVGAITFSTLYFILTYATWMIKSNYDKINMHLRNANIELQEKSNEIAAQNEELLQIQDNLNNLNEDLEKTVNERTARIQLQNEILIKYSYTNAHHLRGPVARPLGLASISKLDTNPDYVFFINKMFDQAKEIDEVIKQINSDLELNQVVK